MKINIENAAREKQKNILQWLAETLSGNLKEMRDRFFLSRKAAEEYIATQSHRHKGDLYIYVDSACRNEEIKTLREIIMGSPYAS